MTKKKLTTTIASAALAASFIIAPVAPANAGAVIQAPQMPRYAVCYYFPFFCR